MLLPDSDDLRFSVGRRAPATAAVFVFVARGFAAAACLGRGFLLRGDGALLQFGGADLEALLDAEHPLIDFGRETPPFFRRQLFEALAGRHHLSDQSRRSGPMSIIRLPLASVTGVIVEVCRSRRRPGGAGAHGRRSRRRIGPRTLRIETAAPPAACWP